MTFEDWFKDLCSNYVWFSPATMHHKPETFRSVANKVYMQYVASESFPPIQEARRHVYNKLVLIPGDKVKKDWYKIEEEKKEAVKSEEWKPVSWEKRAEYLKMVQAEIDRVADEKRIRPLFQGEAEEKGQYDKPRLIAKAVPSSSRITVLRHLVLVRRSRRKFYLNEHPDASEEEIESYLKKFDVI